MTERARRYWGCQAVGWGIYVSVTIFQLWGEVSDSQAVVRPLLSAALGITLTHGVRAVVRRHDWLAHDTLRLLARVVVSTVIVACVHVGVLATVDLVAFGDLPSALTVVFAIMRWILAFFAWHALYVGFALLEQRQQAQLDRIALEHALRDAKLRALEAALNPHFLFNALNTIRALVAEDPARADAAITQLARLLRYALAAGSRELVSMANELAIVDDYLAIEQLRLDVRLKIVRDIDAEARNGRIPAMLVQTLVENAIKHGVARLVEGGTLRIAARLDGNVLAIEIENPIPPTRSSGSGIGLANATERLHLLCGDAASLRLDLTSDRATARVIVPQASS